MEALPHRRKMFIMFGVVLGMLLGALDQTIIGTAMPRIVSELGGMTLLSWVFTAYMLASTASIPIYGKLSDIYGRRLFYIGGVALFITGSMLSGASQTMIQLIAFRGLQGIGAGAMMTNAVAIIGDIFPPSERGKWQGVMGAVFGLSSIIGPLAGGYITDNLSWRWNFYINVPLGLLAILVLFRAIPQIERNKGRVIDWWGSLALLAGIIPLLLALVWGGSKYSWGSSEIISMLAASCLLLVIFILFEKQAKEPVISPALFKNSIFSVSVAIIFITAVGMFGAIVYIPLFLQGVVGKTATNSGFLLFPMMIAVTLSSTISGLIVARSGKYKIVGLIGLAACALGMYLLSLMGLNTQSSEVILNMIILGFGLGITMPIFTVVVQNAFPHREMGVVTAATQFFRSIGGTVGVAIMGGLMNSRLHDEMSRLSAKHADALKLLPSSLVSGLTDPAALIKIGPINEIVAGLHPTEQQALSLIVGDVRLSLSTSITYVFFVGSILLAASVPIMLLMREIPLRRSHEERPILQEAGVELLAEQAQLRPEDEPAFD